MSQYRVSFAADLLGVSADTVRRWISQGRLPSETDAAGRTTVPGFELAKFAQQMNPDTETFVSKMSARNRPVGLVTAVVTDKVMAQVDIQCGPFRFVSLMSAEAVRDLDLKVGDVAAAVVKATNVIVEKIER